MAVAETKVEYLRPVIGQVLAMGMRIEEALGKTAYAHSTRNLELALEATQGLAGLSDDREEIEVCCSKLIATKQPLASALRKIIAIIKIATDLERMAAHTGHLASCLRSVPEFLLEHSLKPLLAGIDAAVSILKSLLVAISEGRSEAWVHDEALFALRQAADQVLETVLAIMEEDRSYIRGGANLIHAARIINRLADHGENIAECLHSGFEVQRT